MTYHWTTCHKHGEITHEVEVPLCTLHDAIMEIGRENGDVKTLGDWYKYLFVYLEMTMPYSEYVSLMKDESLLMYIVEDLIYL